MPLSAVFVCCPLSYLSSHQSGGWGERMVLHIEQLSYRFMRLRACVRIIDTFFIFNLQEERYPGIIPSFSISLVGRLAKQTKIHFVRCEIPYTQRRLFLLIRIREKIGRKK